MHDHISLHPVVETDLPMIEKLTQDRETSGEFGWYGWHDQHIWRRRWDENSLLSEQGGMLMVVAGDERLGLVNWRRHQASPGGHSWEIGIALVPSARGHGYGTQAQRQLARYLFAHTTVHRIFAATETGNIAEQKSLAKAGFTREGVQRGVGWRDGAWRDGVTYSLLRTDPPVLTADG